MTYYKYIGALFLTFSITSFVHADSTLKYELTAASGDKIQHTLSISGRWLRLESEPKSNSDYILMDTGRMLMFSVNDNKKSYQLTRMGRLYWPATPLTSPKLKPIPKKDAVAGVRCQPVYEIGADNKPVAQHCMSTGGSLGLNAREMITLSRLFMSSRRINQGWPSVATSDERQASILSHLPDGKKHIFKSVRHGRIDNKLFKIPRNYQSIKPDFNSPEK